MGHARLHVSKELLREALHLPVATDIRFAMTVDWDTVELIVVHPDLPDVPIVEGQDLPLITPTFRKNIPVEFVDWGIPTPIERKQP